MKQQSVVSYTSDHALITKQHSLTKEQMTLLLHYQTKICQKLEWVETDPDKLIQISELFLKSGYVHENNDLVILKKVIWIYYHIRSLLQPTISDGTIIETIYQQYIFLSGMGIETLYQRVRSAFEIED